MVTTDNPTNLNICPGQARNGTVTRWGPFIAAAFTLAVLIAGTNIPTPLYPRYEHLFGFSSLTVTLVFAVYAIVLIPSLLVFGPLSDAIGRRRVLIPAVIAAAVGAALFAAAAGTGWLFVARVVQGITLGAVQGTASAALVEAEPTGNRARATLAASLAIVVGSAFGPLLGGLLAQYAPAPRVLPYLVEIVLLAAALAGLLRLSPAEPKRGTRWQPRRPSVPAPIRRTFAVAAMSALLAWAVTGLFLALMPSYVTTLLHTGNLALAGGIVTVMLGCSGVAQLTCRRMNSLTAQTVGLCLLLAGLAVVIVAAQTAWIVAVFCATVLAGFGQGLAFSGSLSEINAIAPPDRKAEVVSGFYVVIYLGVGLPTIGVGLIALITGLLGAVQIFAYVVIAACVVGLIVHRIDGRRADRLLPTVDTDI